jgi:light-regulated signal transduction histidine kinase (bacteriophytochrome)
MENKKNDEDLARKLAEQEEIFRALRNEEVDAVVGTKNVLFLRLKETEDELKKQRRHLEELLAERTKLLEDLKIQQEELRRAHDGLEHRVRERTAELERRNLQLQEFAFVASHDLSEPLRKIQTFGSLLEAKSADLMDELSKGYVSRMTGAASRMQELLDALLRYSRVDTTKMEFKPTKLEGVVRDSLIDLEVSIHKANAQVEIGSLPAVIGDPRQLRQLFQNLIGNSLKYCRSEVKPLVRVYGEDNHNDCRIFVEDNGIGFDEKYLEKIFQPFQRLHGRNEYPGTGIGLAICRKIVERHKGTITAKSTPGKGSTFIVTLPVERVK